MRLTRVHVGTPLEPGARLRLPEGAARHLVRVLRLGPGARLCLFNGMGGEFAAEITAVRRDVVEVLVGTHDQVERESPLRLTLLQGIARGEKMDLILQKATELGVAAVVPVQMARSTVRLDHGQAEAKRRHWQSVVISACEQSGRNTVPTVAEPRSLAAALEAATGHKLMMAPGAGSTGLSQWLTGCGLGNGAEMSLLVGPEGGFDDAETAAAGDAGFLRCRMGPRVLRTETAALVALAALQALGGDLAQ